MHLNAKEGCHPSEAKTCATDTSRFTWPNPAPSSQTNSTFFDIKCCTRENTRVYQ